MSNEQGGYSGPYTDWEEDRVKLHDIIETAGVLRTLLQDYLDQYDLLSGVTITTNQEDCDGTFIVRDNTSGAEYEVSVTKLSQKGASNE